jgi:hypothetical protein
MLDFIFYASIEKHKCYNFLHRLQKWNEWLQIYKIIYEKIQNIIFPLTKSIYRNIVGFESQSGQTKDYQIIICYFSAKHATLRPNSKDWLARNLDNVSQWSDMSVHGLLFPWACTIKIQLSMLV